MVSSNSLLLFWSLNRLKEPYLSYSTDRAVWIVCIELSLLRREYLSPAVNVLTKTLQTFHGTKGDLSNSITLKVINQYRKGAVVKIESVFCCVYHVACREVLPDGSFQTFMLPRLSRWVISEIQKLWGSYFFWICSKFDADLEKAEKNSEKVFCFRDKYTWIVCIELSLLIREYLSSAVHVLTKSLKTFHVTKSDFSNSITFKLLNQYGKGAGVKVESVFRPVHHVACQGVIWKGSF